MEDEPQLDTRIRNDDFDIVAGCLVERIVESLVVVPIKDTPHLVVGPTTTLPLFTGLLTLRFNGGVHQCEWFTMDITDGDIHAVPVFPAPVNEVAVLGAGAFGEYE